MTPYLTCCQCVWWVPPRGPRELVSGARRDIRAMPDGWGECLVGENGTEGAQRVAVYTPPDGSCPHARPRREEK